MGQPVVHFEIGVKDSQKAQEFYRALFDWKIEPMGPAGMITTGGVGINGHINSLGHEPHNYCTLYVQVDDIPAYLEKATALGGKTLVPMVPIPGVGFFAWLADPEGTIVGLLKPNAS